MKIRIEKDSKRLKKFYYDLSKAVFCTSVF